MKFQGVQLAKEYSPTKAVFPMLAEPKLDGYRLMAVVDEEGNSVFHCRDEKPVDWQHNLRHIAADIKAAGFRDCLIDGEVMADTWNQTSIVRITSLSAAGAAYLKDSVRYYMFDYITPSTITHTQLYRRSRLENAMTSDSPRLALVSQEEVFNHLEVVEYQKRALELGYEGSMLKDPNALYSFKRSAAWQKVKPVRTLELLVLGCVEGKGKHKGRLGALQCQDAAGNRIDVGGGFSDVERQLFWDSYQALGVKYWGHGQVIEISAQDDKVAKVARNPVWLRFRPDRTDLR